MCSEGGLPLIDCPADYGPSTTVYNPFNRSHRGFWLHVYLVDRHGRWRVLAMLEIENGGCKSSSSSCSSWIKHSRHLAMFGRRTHSLFPRS